MEFILALDQGTTSSRAILFDRNARIHGKSQQEFPQIFPRPGWVEHDPRDILNSQMEVAQEVIREHLSAEDQILAVGIANQRETVVLWNRKTGEPLANAIVWQDRRTVARCDQLAEEEGLVDRIQQRSGLILDAYFSATKLAWFLDHLDGARAAAERGELAFGTIDTWLIWNLTGGKSHVTDMTNACRTMLFNIQMLDWDEELLELFRIPRSLLPEIRGNAEELGVISDEFEGLAGLRIMGAAGDQQAALFGQACHTPGQAKNTYGTGCFILKNIGQEPVISQNRLLTTVAWHLGGETNFCLEGSVFVAGAAIQWLRDQMGLFASADEVEEIARSVEDNGGVYFMPAFAGLGAPHWDGWARGAILGLTRGTEKAHLVRAALESIALQSWEVLQAMEKDSGLAISELRVDGGASVNNLLMQIQSDLLGAPVIRPTVNETTALGAACFAGLSVGLWSDLQEIRDIWKEDQRFQPMSSAEELENVKTFWKRAVDRTRQWAREPE